MKQLTDKQRAIYEYIRDHHRREAYWPSIRQIQAHFGFSSTNAVVGHLRALDRKNVISRVPGQARAYRVPEAEMLALMAVHEAARKMGEEGVDALRAPATRGGEIVPFEPNLAGQRGGSSAQNGSKGRVAVPLHAHREMAESDPEAQDGTVLSLPIYGSIAAGYPDGIETSGEVGRLQLDRVSAGVRSPGQAFALKVRGESMIDAGIHDGDIVIVEPGEARDGDIVAALIDNATTLKRYVQPRNGAPYLRAENSRYPELHPMAELLVQGIARTVVRRL